MGSVVISRTPEVIAAEINSIKEQTRIQVLCNSIEIGRKLKEAKELVHHGEWGDWLKEKVSYSKSTANNLMKIFEEYGNDQISLLGDNAKSQAFGNLSYSKAVALLGIDTEEREKFIEENNVEEMSARELKQAIADKKKAEEEAKKAKEELEKFKSKSKEEQEKIKRLEEEKNKLSETLTRESDKLLRQLDSKEEENMQAQKEVEELKSKIKELEDKPVEVITGTDEKELNELKEKHAAEVAELRNKLQEAEERAESKSDNQEEKKPEVITKFEVHFNLLTETFKDILNDVEDIKEIGQGEKYSSACKKLINIMLERL